MDNKKSYRGKDGYNKKSGGNSRKSRSKSKITPGKDTGNRKNENRDNRSRSTSGSYRGGKKAASKNQARKKKRYDYRSKPLAEETVDDVKADITRIQKEISLEIKEIRSLKL